MMMDSDERADAAVELLRAAGSRAPVPSEKAVAVHAAVHAHWELRVAALARRRRWWVAASVSAAASLMAVLLMLPAPGRSSEVGTVVRVKGEVNWTLQGAPLAVAAGDVIEVGTVVDTAPGGRVALRMEDDASLRLDIATRLEIQDRHTLRLERGAAYLDSSPKAAGQGFTVVTNWGDIREVGTQFEVRISDSKLRVRVREGKVAVPGRRQVGAGQEVILSPDGTLTLRPVTATDPGWSWLLEVAPSFVPEGESVGAFLRWVTRETGLQLTWDEPTLATEAESMILHGELAGVRPDEAVHLVLPSSGLEYRVDGGRLAVGRRGDR